MTQGGGPVKKGKPAGDKILSGSEQEERKNGGGNGQQKRLTFAVDRLTLQGDNRVSFHDRSVPGGFSTSLSPLTLEMENFGNSGDTGKTTLDLQGGLGEYGELAATGTMQLFGETRDMNLEIDIREYDLTRLSPYTRRQIGYTVESGQLQADISWQVRADQLEGLFDLVLVKADFARVAAAEMDEMTGGTGIPLDKGMDFLRDKEENIHLSVPVSGDMSDPSFHLRKIFWSAFARTLRESTLSYFAPIGIATITGATLPVGAVWVAGRLFSEMTALRLEPLILEPLHSELLPEQEKRLDTLAGLLNDRPEVELVICGMAARPDLEALRGISAGKETADRKATGGGPDEEEHQAMLDLADRRSQAVKTYLVNSGIASDRLVTCRPEYTADPDARPAVELGV